MKDQRLDQQGDWVGDESSVELFFTRSLEVRWNYGALCIEARHANGGIELEVFVSGVRVGGGVFGAGEEVLSLNAQVGLAKAKVNLEARFAQRELWVSGETAVRGLEDWTARQLEERILAW